jgi:hypothetical protein
MSANDGPAWRISGEEIVHCNCDWGCPCQFNAPPTYARCEAFGVIEIRDGHYGDVSLSGVRFARVVTWPGRIDEGDGSRQTWVDERATPEQVTAVDEIESGAHGGTFFEIFAAVAPHRGDTLTAPIELEFDRDRRVSSLRVGDVIEARAEPITNPVTGDEHRAQIVLPDGFEYTSAEMANTVFARVNAEAPLGMQLENSYAQINEFTWSNG